MTKQVMTDEEMQKAIAKASTRIIIWAVGFVITKYVIYRIIRSSLQNAKGASK